MPPVNPHAEQLQAYYEAMSAARKRLVVPLVTLTLVYFFTLVILTNFTSLLDGYVVPGLTWAYAYAISTFFFVVIVTTYYRRQMSKLDAGLGRGE